MLHFEGRPMTTSPLFFSKTLDSMCPAGGNGILENNITFWSEIVVEGLRESTSSLSNR